MKGPLVLLIAAFFFSISSTGAKLTLSVIPGDDGTGILLLTRGLAVLTLGGIVLLWNAWQQRRLKNEEWWRWALPIATSRPVCNISSFSSSCEIGSRPQNSSLEDGRPFYKRLVEGSVGPFPRFMSLLTTCGLPVPPSASHIRFHILWPILRGSIAAVGLCLVYTGMSVLPLPQSIMLYSVAPVIAAIETSLVVKLLRNEDAKTTIVAALAANAVSGRRILIALAIFCTGAVAAFVATMNSLSNNTPSATAASSERSQQVEPTENLYYSILTLIAGACSGTAITCAKMMMFSPSAFAPKKYRHDPTTTKEEEDNDNHINGENNNEEKVVAVATVDLGTPSNVRVDVVEAPWVAVAWWQGLFCVLSVPFVSNPVTAIFALQQRLLLSSDGGGDLDTLVLLRLMCVGFGTFLGQSGVGMASRLSDTPPFVISILIQCDAVFDFFIWQPLVFHNFSSLGLRFISVASIIGASSVLAKL